MTCAVCPNCGLDLERFEPTQIGDLEITSPYEVRWKGNTVPLRPSGRLMVTAVARAKGIPITLTALGEILGCEDSTNPDDVVRTQMCFARQTFRALDPEFAAIKTVWGTGFRWAA